MPKWCGEWTGLGVLSLLLLQFIFFMIQSQTARNEAAALTSILTNTNAFLNPLYLSQASAGLESGGLVSCVSIRKAGDKLNFYESGGSNCERSVYQPIFLAGEACTATVNSANGQSWEVSFRSENGALFYIALWALRIFSLMFIGGLLSRNEWRLEVQRQLEEARLRTALDLANLASQVSHDIRSPLAALEAALSSVSDLSRDQERMIGAAASRIREIANDLLSHGRVDGGAASVEVPSPHSIAQIVEPLVDEKRLEIRSRTGIRLELIVRRDAFVRVVPSELRRVLSNLINNAVESMSSGVVNIAVELVDGRVAIRIIDGGRGIVASMLKEIGNRGFSQKRGGSGLGVFYARDRVSAWGGQLVMESEVGKGTCVSILLPCLEPLLGDSAPGRITRTVVLLDDDEMMHTLWRISAERVGNRVECFFHSKDLEEKLRRYPKDIEIYLDAHLSDGDSEGVLVAKSLHERGFLNLFLTTGSRPERFKDIDWIKKVIGKSPPWL